MMAMSQMQLMGTAEVARTLGNSPATVNRLVSAGTLTPLGTIGKRRIRVFDRAEIERLAAESAEGVAE